MPKYAVQLANGHKYEVSSDKDLSDAEAHQHAVSMDGSGGDTSTEPGTFWGGFFDHLLTKEKPTVAALASAPLLPLAAAGAIGGGVADAGMAAAPTLADAGSRLYNWIKGRKQEPVTGGELAEDAMGPAMVYGPGAVGKGASWLAKSPTAARIAGAVTGAATGSSVGHPIIGAVLGEREGGPAVQKLASVMSELEGKTPSSLVTPAEDAAPIIDRYSPNTGGSAPVSQPAPSSYRIPITGDVAASTAPMASTVPGRVVGKAPTLNGTLQDILESLRSDSSPATATSGKLADTPSARFPAQPDAAVSTPAARKAALAFRSLSPAEIDNIAHNAPYGEGALMPSTMIPTELRDSAAEGLNHPSTPFRIESPASASASAPASDGPSYSKWASDMDDIINGAQPEDLPNWKGGSKPTKAWRAFLKTPIPGNGSAPAPTSGELFKNDMLDKFAQILSGSKS